MKLTRVFVCVLAAACSFCFSAEITWGPDVAIDLSGTSSNTTVSQIAISGKNGIAVWDFNFVAQAKYI